jgi:2-polyprenyl-3-methyl-5-hydroxy-6-metoxy-1,4-benzoquinol methylase
MSQELVYLNYWQRKELLKTKVLKFPVIKWWQSSELCEVERIIFDNVKNRENILDIGAGDLKLKHKLQQAGYRGDYHTQDIGEEFTYDYNNLDEITNQYSAIICLDVIEHLSVAEGLSLIHKLSSLLTPDGVMIIQTPNGRCIRNPLISDMTHIHCYNLPDLWAYLTCLNLRVEGFRVVFEALDKSYLQKMRELLGKYIITHLFGLDYADNIIVIAYK